MFEFSRRLKFLLLDQSSSYFLPNFPKRFRNSFHVLKLTWSFWKTTTAIFNRTLVHDIERFPPSCCFTSCSLYKQMLTWRSTATAAKGSSLGKPKRFGSTKGERTSTTCVLPSSGEFEADPLMQNKSEGRWTKLGGRRPAVQTRQKSIKRLSGH